MLFFNYLCGVVVIRLRISKSGLSMLYNSSLLFMIGAAIVSACTLITYYVANFLSLVPSDYDWWCVVGVMSVFVLAFVLLKRSLLTTIDVKAGKLVVDELFVFSRREVLLIDVEGAQSFFIEKGSVLCGVISGFDLKLAYQSPAGEYKVKKVGFGLDVMSAEAVLSAVNLVLADAKAREGDC